MRLVWLVSIIAAGIALGGCAGGRGRAGAGTGDASAARALPEDRPPDFTLSVTVYSPAQDEAEIAAAPRTLRPARYVMEADGLLRAQVSPGLTPESFPTVVRRLDDRQMTRIWRQLRLCGYTVPGHPSQLSSESAYLPRSDRPVAVVGYSFAGRVAAFRAFLDRASADAVAAERLVDLLASLAWLEG